MEKTNRKKDLFALIGIILLVYLVFVLFTGIGPFTENPYNSYSLQAKAWLEGRLDLGQNYSHLEIATYEGKYYISFPPFPSMVMLLFVPFMGVQTPDHLLCFLALLLGAVFAYMTAVRLKWEGKYAVVASLFLTIGGNLTFVGFCGWVWFIAQTFSFALCMAAFYFAIGGGKKGAFLSLFLLACAVGCRPFQLVYLPLILYLFWKKEKDSVLHLIKKYWYCCLPAFALGCVYMALNYFRFGNIFEFGHNYLPEFLEAADGQFSLAYLPGNLLRLFQFPPMANGVLSLPQFNGFAFYLASPLFLAVILSSWRLKNQVDKEKRRVIVLAFGLIIIHFLLLCMHKTMGGWQFGNRYTADALPAAFLAYLLLKQKPGWTDMALFVFGLSLNLVGAVLTYLI